MNKENNLISRIIEAIDASVIAETPIAFTHKEAAIIGELMKIALVLISEKLQEKSEDSTNETD